MSDPTKPGQETTEYKVMLWIGIVSGMIAAALAALVSAGIVPPDSTGGAILAAAVPIFGALGAMGGKSYVDGRSNLKVANARLAAAKELNKELDSGNP